MALQCYIICHCMHAAYARTLRRNVRRAYVRKASASDLKGAATCDGASPSFANFWRLLAGMAVKATTWQNIEVQRGYTALIKDS